MAVIRTAKEKRPERIRARRAVEYARKRGALVKPAACEDCGTVPPRQRLHAHHEDYTKALDVVWVCGPCHGKRHRLEREVRNA